MKKKHKAHSSHELLSVELSEDILSLVHADGPGPQSCKIECGYDENGDWRCVHICPRGSEDTQ